MYIFSISRGTQNRDLSLTLSSHIPPNPSLPYIINNSFQAQLIIYRDTKRKYMLDYQSNLHIVYFAQNLKRYLIECLIIKISERKRKSLDLLIIQSTK